MFSSSVGRVVRPSCCTATTTAAAAPGTTVVRAAVRGHQRRPSSSKTSVPPDGSKRIAPAQQAQKAAGSGARKSRAKSGRTGTRGASTKGQFVPLSTFYPEMPDPVRATSHLKPEDIPIMQLFAGYRPINVNQIMPASVSDAQFEALFQPKSTWDKYNETVGQLSGVIDGLENVNAEEMDESMHVVHLDSVDSVADPIAHYLRMNRPPPPPRPIEEIEQEKQNLSARSFKRTRKGKSWQTTITVTEYTDGQGHRTFRADSSPIVRVPRTEGRIIEAPSASQKASIQQPFLDRMRLRQQKWRDTNGSKIRHPVKKPRMILISVRRQRKAKMKKHKLKKLRKRTRNLRRKLGKL